MRKLLLFVFLLSILRPEVIAQKSTAGSMGIGLKAGYNFAKVTGASSVNAANTNGLSANHFIYGK